MEVEKDIKPECILVIVVGLLSAFVVLTTEFLPLDFIACLALVLSGLFGFIAESVVRKLPRQAWRVATDVALCATLVLFVVVI